MSKMKIAVALEHAEAKTILKAAGLAVPEIPAGMNTVITHFTTAEGRAALCVNQRGFASELADDGQEVNGCMVAVCMDATDPARAAAALDAWVDEVLR